MSGEGEKEWERDRISSDSMLSREPEPHGGLDLTTHEIIIGAKTKSPTPH